jgi:DNA-binding GntR family transcriptional regulator
MHIRGQSDLVFVPENRMRPFQHLGELPMKSNVSADKLVSQIVERIHDKISLGELGPGDRLRQEALAEEFEVSRTPIREAIRQLEARGIVTQEHRHSAVIRAPSTREIREIYQIRAMLEGLAAQLAATWISDDQLTELATIHERFAAAVEEMATEKRAGRQRSKEALRPTRKWINTNGEFHSLIYHAGNNLELIKIIENLFSGYTRSIMAASALVMDRHRKIQNIRDHEQILLALQQRDASAAKKAMQSHVLESGTFVAAWLENRPASQD